MLNSEIVGFQSKRLIYYLRKTIQRTGRKNGKVYQGFDFTALS